jgi:hypothetical protein
MANPDIMQYDDIQVDDDESNISLFTYDNNARVGELDQCRARVVELEQQVDQMKKDAEKKEEEIADKDQEISKKEQEIADKDKRLADHEATVARQAYGLSCLRVLVSQHLTKGGSVDSDMFPKPPGPSEKRSIAPWYKQANQGIRLGKHAQEQAHKVTDAMQQALTDLGIEAKLSRGRYVTAVYSNHPRRIATRRREPRYSAGSPERLRANH